MKFRRLATPAAIAVVLVCASSLTADTIGVQFGGTITTTNAPGISVGESFSGGFTYTTTDPLETSIAGLNSYAMVSPEDSVFVSVGGLDLSLAQPLSGVTAIVGQGPLSIDTNPDQDFFAIQSFSSPGTTSVGISIQLIGDLNFLSSGALPDPFNAADVTLGGGSGLTSSIGFDFTDAKNNSYTVEGEITQISTVPEPRGLGLASLGVLALALLAFRRSAEKSPSKSS